MSSISQYLHGLALRDGGGVSDGELLSAFVRRRDEAALAALVKRHGPLVWGVCRRLLRNHHDAEDAFQATFLVLVRKAAAVRDREAVATRQRRHGIFSLSLNRNAAQAVHHSRSAVLLAYS
jgi:RNA polymerase sigma-70 factor (ECF subfamily)